jgi:hypothetical protein
MAQTESTARFEVRLKGVLEKTASWARVLHDERIELEYYDFSSSAQEWFGNDVAWMYHIEASEKARLFTLLAVADDESMLQALVTKFGDVKQVKEWLRANHIAFREEFDSWA